MTSALRLFSTVGSIFLLCILLCACSGDSPWRYNPGMPDVPAGLTAAAGNGQVTLSWPAVGTAAAYNVYYSTSPSVSRTAGIKIANVVSTSCIVSGLTNDTTFYFVITSVNSSGESAESNPASATPALPGPYVQGDLEGTWDFNVLVSGTGAGWMRGRLVVSGTGSVAFSSFLDSAGNSQPPAGLFPQLFLSPTGTVRDGNSGTATFLAELSLNREMIVGISSPLGASRYLAVLQKQVPGIAFSIAGDIQGFGSTGGGGRRFIYNQISSGASQEWEFAAGQIGKDQKIQYTTFNAPSNPVKPGDKASMFTISGDGIVTESFTAVLPQPATVIDRGVMSADKSVIIGTATDTSGGSPRYILRIYQLVNILSNDPNTFAPADLAGTYSLHKLLCGANTLSASGTMTIDASGSAAFSSYADSSGSSVLPPDVSLAMDGSGTLTTAADPTLLGKFSYFKDMFVVTMTDAPGSYSLSIALKR